MRVVDIILKKKNGFELTEEEIHFIIDGYVKKEIPDYQMSSLLMAICFQGLNENERFFFTKEMLESGETIDLSNVSGICVDKHSTGGVGDKTTLVVCPIIACCGLKIAKMSGKGLGHTGGTLDKLESIPGYKIAMSKDDFINQVNDIGISVVGQTVSIAPADKLIYALRDVTGTIESIGLISSSIMSKKLASGASHILLDVKVGSGAFMKNQKEATDLAKSMVKIGSMFNRKVVAMLTDMDQPLGEEIGNSNEVIEAIETLKGRGPKDFTELCYNICIEMLKITGVCPNHEEAYEMVHEKVVSGEALEKFRQMIVAQGGDGEVVNDYKLFAQPKEQIVVYPETSGFVKSIDTKSIGDSVMLLGAGRQKIGDSIDPAVGVKVLAHKGDYVDNKHPLGIIYSNDKNTVEAINKFKKSFTITKEEVKKTNIILDVIGE